MAGETPGRDRSFAIEGYVGHVWCVTERAASATTLTCSTLEIEVIGLLEKQLHPKFESVAREASIQGKIQTTVRKEILLLSLGDVCVFLRTESFDSNGTVCIFVGSPVRGAFGLSPECLLWAKVDRTSEDRPFVRMVAHATLKGLPVWVSGRRKSPNFKRNAIEIKGKLPDGMPYYLYRVALYAGGLQQQKSMTDIRSVTGVYIMPLGPPCHTVEIGDFPAMTVCRTRVILNEPRHCCRSTACHTRVPRRLCTT